MLFNHLKIAFRNLWKNRFYTGINIVGLAAGIVCFLLIVIFVQDESSYDHYHELADRIYRIDFQGRMGETEVDIPEVGAPVGATLLEEFPEFETYTRLRARGSFLVTYENQSFREERVIYADSTLFDVFSFTLLQGNPSDVLRAPQTMVISESLAQKYFGRENPIGKTLRLDDDEDFTVMGVMADMPNNSHFRRDMLLSLSSLEESRSPLWTNMNFHTYLVLREHANIAQVEAKLPDFLRRYMGVELEQFLNVTFEDFLAAGNYGQYSLMPLTDIYLNSKTPNELDQGGDAKYLYIFSCIGLFILLLACINFINLATARAATRAREVGVRKVVGAEKLQLVTQFLSESTILASVALIVAIVGIALVLPFFNTLTSKNLEIVQLAQQPWLWLVIIGLVGFIGVMAGIYPAFYLTRFQPIRVLKSNSGGRNVSKSTFRNSLVVFQFAITALLLTATFVVYQQMNYIQNKKLGFDKEQLLLLRGAWVLGDQLDAFKEEMSKDPRVTQVAATSYLPIPSSRNSRGYSRGRSMNFDNSNILQAWYVDEDFVPTMDIQLVAGRNFSDQTIGDTSAVLINQTAVEVFGFEDPIGQEISSYFNTNQDGDSELRIYTIIGVVEDFHYESLRQRINPMIIHRGNSNGYVVMRVGTEDIAGLLAVAQNLWRDMAGDAPMEHSFLDEGFDQIYQAELRTSRIASVFTGLAMLIACIGLLGLATFTVAQRRKEISIRKVMGASVEGLFFLLVKDFGKLVLIAFVLSIPVAVYMMQQWLQGFEYATKVGPMVFGITAIALLGIAVLAITYQAIRVARINPVNSLRGE